MSLLFGMGICEGGFERSVQANSPVDCLPDRGFSAEKRIHRKHYITNLICARSYSERMSLLLGMGICEGGFERSVQANSPVDCLPDRGFSAEKRIHRKHYITNLICARSYSERMSLLLGMGICEGGFEWPRPPSLAALRQFTLRRLLASVRWTLATAVAFPQKSESIVPPQKTANLRQKIGDFYFFPRLLVTLLNPGHLRWRIFASLMKSSLTPNTLFSKQ